MFKKEFLVSTDLFFPYVKKTVQVENVWFGKKTCRGSPMGEKLRHIQYGMDLLQFDVRIWCQNFMGEHVLCWVLQQNRYNKKN